MASGDNTTASGNNATALGNATTASGTNATSLGTNTEAVGENAYVGGNNSTATGSNSIAFGLNTNAINANAVAMGENTTASGRTSVAIGRELEASGKHSTAFGYQNIASNDEAFVAGRLNEANGENSVVLGRESEANGENAVAIGFSVSANADNSFAIGKNVVNNEHNSIRIGFNKSKHDKPVFCAYNNKVGILNTNPSYHFDTWGKVRGTHFIKHSDKRYKNKVNSLKNSIDKISKLRSVEYFYKNKEEWVFDDRKQIGFIAQELQEVFPELVYTDNEGFLSVDYVSLIPVLADGINVLSEEKDQYKELIEDVYEDNAQLSNQVNDMKEEVTAVKQEMQNYLVTIKEVVKRVCEGDCNAVYLLESHINNEGIEIDEDALSEAARASELYQNIPNPTMEKQVTTIPYYINEDARKARLLITDIAGREIVDIWIEERGVGSYVLNTTNLETGTYPYTLYVDHEPIGSKKIIIK